MYDFIRIIKEYTLHNLIEQKTLYPIIYSIREKTFFKVLKLLFQKTICNRSRSFVRNCIWCMFITLNAT